MSSKEWQYIIGFGSLLSEKSARSTMPNLRNFQFCKLSNYRRVFAHPAGFFMKHKIGNIQTKEVASLSIEYDPSSDPFIVSVFQIPISELNAFYTREDEFDFKHEKVQICTKQSNKSLQILDDLLCTFDEGQKSKKNNEIDGILCVRSTDEAYIKRWGIEKFEKEWKEYGFETIWNWKGPIYPCRVYLRHCLLSIQKQGDEYLNDFMKNTFLYDRKTTIEAYMKQNPDVYDEVVPDSLKNRYNG